MSEQTTPRRWRRQPLFISSTFRDMQAERDHLHDEVFPALEEWLRSYRTLLEPLDLRWGVETSDEGEAQEKEKRVLKVCLDGIVECKPYLIVLLGDRYGWVPPPKRLADAAKERGYSQDAVAGMSVTALEIEDGVFRDEGQAQRSLVYLRHPLPYAEMRSTLRPVYSDAEAGHTDQAERLDALKQRLRDDPRLSGRVKDYSLDWDAERQRPTSASLRAWGEQVLADLKAALAPDVEAHAEHSGELTWRDEEAFELEAFVEHRTRIFVGREATIEAAEALAFGPDAEQAPWAAVYTGAAGAGKSALAAALYDRWRKRDDAVILAHAAGISPRSAWITPMLRRWIATLAAIQGIAEPVGDDDDHDSVVAAFKDLVTAVARHRRVVLLIDAINQFEARAWQDQSWVPAGRPNIRLIATAIPGRARERLQEAHEGVEPRELPPLSADEAGEIATALCKRYHKKLADNVRTALKSHPSAANALWLRMAIDELLLLDADDFEQAEHQYADRAPDERIPAHMEHLLTEVFPTDVPGMYGHLLERMEERFGQATVRAFALAIALSRRGWREQGLKALVPKLGGTWDDAIGANLRRAFRLHLIRHGDPPAWDFFHPVARQAVVERYPASTEERQAQHAAIAEYLAELPDDDPIATRERMHHLIEADDIPNAAAFYAQLDNEHPGLEPATRSIADRVIEGENVDTDNPGLMSIERLLNEAARTPLEWLQLPRNLLLFVTECVRGEVSEGTTRALVALVHSWYTNNRPTEVTARYLQDLSASKGRLGELERSAGNAQAARGHFEQALAVAKDLHARIDTGDTARDLSLNHERLGDLENAAGNRQSARNHFERGLELTKDRHARIDSADTAFYLSISYNELGDLEFSENDPRTARKYYCQALKVAQDAHRRIAAAHTGALLSSTRKNLGDVERMTDNTELARGHYESALAIAESLHGRMANPHTTHDRMLSYTKLGDMELSSGNMQAARGHYEQALGIAWDLHARIESADSARDLSVNHIKLGNLEKAEANPQAARDHYRQSQRLREDLHTRSPSANSARDLFVSHDRLGELEHAESNRQAALGDYGQSHRLRQAARDHYEQSHRLREDAHARVAGADTAHVLCMSLVRLKGICTEQNDGEAERYYAERLYAMLSEMTDNGYDLNERMKQIHSQLEQRFSESSGPLRSYQPTAVPTLGESDINTHAEFAAELLRDAADFFDGLGAQDASRKYEMDHMRLVYSSMADLLEADPGALMESEESSDIEGGQLSHAGVAAKLLQDAANFFEHIGSRNSSLKGQMEEKSRVYREAAQWVVCDPTSRLEGGEG